MVDGFDNLRMHLCVTSHHRETLGARAFNANAHYSCHSITGSIAVYGYVNGQLKPHIEMGCSASTYEIQNLQAEIIVRKISTGI